MKNKIANKVISVTITDVRSMKLFTRVVKSNLLDYHNFVLHHSYVMISCLCHQLSSIIGLPWIMGYIIETARMPDGWWYAFISLTSLQGPMIFTSFILHKRVIGLWCAKVE